ncbi:hypothetical protein EC988_006371, partial [Linderina pennispora]
MSIREWISDAIIELVGESNSDIVDYVLHLAKTCASESDLTKSLVTAELPSSPATEAFAKQLFARVPRAAAKPQASQRSDPEKVKPTAALADDGLTRSIKIKKSEDGSEPRVRGKNIRKRVNTSEDEEDREELEARIKRAKTG